ncbi:proteinase-activated receptor 3 [Menidia menidia]
MGKLFPCALLFVLLMRGTLQKKAVRGTTGQRNGSVVPRSFIGIPVDQTKSVLNGTPSPISTHSLPALQSLSNATIEYLRGPLSTRVIPVLYLLMAAVGIPANLAILSLLAGKIRKVSSAILYCSLAVSDLLLLVSLFFKAHYHLQGNHWQLGEAACRAVAACFYGNLYCSALTLACISVKRYLAVAHPFLYKSLPKRAATVWASVGVWALFGAAVTPELTVRQSYWLPELNRTSCHDVLPLDRPSHAFLLYSNLALSVAGLLLPLLVAVACFARIVCELNRSHYDWAAYVKASSLVFAIFVACFLPAAALRFLHYARLVAGGDRGLYAHFNAAACLCCLHACLDPFLFLLMSKSAGAKLLFMTFRGKTVSISL